MPSGAPTWMSAWLLCLLLLLPLHAAAEIAGQPAARIASGEPAPVRLGPDFTEISLAGHLALLRDPGQQLGLSEVAFGARATDFQPLARHLALGYTSDAAWLRLRLQRSMAWPAGLYILFQPTYVDRVEIYVPQTAEPKTAADFVRFELGDHIPGYGRKIVMPLLAHDLTLPDTDQTELYIRVTTTSTLALQGSLATFDAVIRTAQQRTLIFAVLLSIMSAFLLIHVTYWIVLKQPLFLWFSALLVADAASILTDTGILDRGWRIGSQFTTDILTGWSVILVVATSAGFIRWQLETRRFFPRLDLLLRHMKLPFIVPLLATVAGYYQYVVEPVLVAGLVLVAIMVLGNGWLLWRHRRPGAVLATLASLVYALGAGLSISRLLGLVDLTLVTVHGFHVTLILFVTLMSLSLLQRARVIDRRRRESVTLRMARKAERDAKVLVGIRTAELEKAIQKAEAALASERAAQAEQVRFVDVISHQYQTPLAVIRSSASAIQHTLPSNDTANRQRIEQIKAAIRTLLEVLDVSLQRNRVEGLTSTPELKPVNACAFVSDVTKRAATLHQPRELVLRANAVPADLEVDLDPAMVTIAVTNLIENAMKFSPSSSRVEIALSREDNDLVIEVLDEGIGVPAGEEGRLMQRYSRGSNTGAVPGSGLGLHMVQAIANAHGGEFHISRREGAGTSARLKLPTS